MASSFQMGSGGMQGLSACQRHRINIWGLNEESREEKLANLYQGKEISDGLQ